MGNRSIVTMRQYISADTVVDTTADVGEEMLAAELKHRFRARRPPTHAIR
jgi:hypothetical protein